MNIYMCSSMLMSIIVYIGVDIMDDNYVHIDSVMEYVTEQGLLELNDILDWIGQASVSDILAIEQKCNIMVK